MPTKEAATLNGMAPSWQDIGLSFGIYGGEQFSDGDIKAVNWSDSVELGIVRGTSGGKIRKRTKGQYSCEASVTFYKEGWDKFQAKLASVSEAISDVGFDVTIQHTPIGASKIYKVVIKGCRVTGRSNQNAEGVDPTEYEIALNPVEIEDDGKKLV